MPFAVQFALGLATYLFMAVITFRVAVSSNERPDDDTCLLAAALWPLAIVVMAAYAVFSGIEWFAGISRRRRERREFLRALDDRPTTTKE